MPLFLKIGDSRLLVRVTLTDEIVPKAYLYRENSIDLMQQSSGIELSMPCVGHSKLIDLIDIYLPQSGNFFKLNLGGLLTPG